jgi:hypothetical protein
VNVTKADPTLRLLDLGFDGKNETVNVNATASTAALTLSAEGLLDRVNLRGNSGAVRIAADPTATVELGSNFFFAQSVTSGINANVTVLGGHLQIADAGNATTQEHVKVTESTIAGTGLFGNSGVVLSYQNLSSLLMFTGRLANTYTVAPSHLFERFSTGIVIDDFASGAGLDVTVDVDSNSGLNLHLINANPKTGHLFISAPGGKFNPLKPVIPNGTETVTFTPGVTSTVQYIGFGNVGHS